MVLMDCIREEIFKKTTKNGTSIGGKKYARKTVFYILRGYMKKIKVSYMLMLPLLAILLFMPGCSSFNKFEAYYQPIELEDMVSLDGELYYADSQVLLTAIKKTSFDDIKKVVKETNGEIVGYIFFQRLSDTTFREEDFSGIAEYSITVNKKQSDRRRLH